MGVSQMMWLLRLILTIYFIPAKIICGITVLLLIVDTVFGRKGDGYGDPIAKVGGLSGVILILVTSYLLWPYYLWLLFNRKQKK